MHLLDNGTQVASLGAPQAAVGTPGYPATGIPGTFAASILDPDIVGTWLAESVNLVTATGQALSRTDNTQFRTAVRIVGAAGYTVISASATLTVGQAGMVAVDATAGNVTITLPAANAAPLFAVRFDFVRSDLSANTVAVVPAGADQFKPGSLTAMPLFLGAPLTLVSDAVSAWWRRSADRQGVVVFATPGAISWTVPNDVTRIKRQIWGAGGGSDGSVNAVSWVCGAGGGGYIESVDVVTPGATITGAVGAGGAAGLSGAGGGTAGGSSSFGGMTATGGGRGQPSIDGSAGVGSGGNVLNMSGQPGSSGVPISGGGQGGAGGAGAMGGGGGAAGNSSAQPGTRPGGGAGGPGANISQAGQPGGDGMVIVRYGVSA